MKLQSILALEIYGMVVYKIYLNTNIEVHIKIQVDGTDKKRNRNWYGKIALILFQEKMEKNLHHFVK